MAPNQTGIARKRRWIMALTSVLIGLIGLIAVTERQRFVENSSIQLLSTEQASRIYINLNNDKNTGRVELQRQAGVWRMISPSEASVNQDRINPLLSLLTLPDSTAYSVADVDLEELGLAQPRATIEINGHIFTFGGPGPGEQQRYLMINNTVYLTRDILLPLVAGGADSLITATAE